MKTSYTPTSDGSYTLFSSRYNQNYHSTKDGALSESLIKHIEPAFEIFKDSNSLNILDICFGLGYNTLATLYYVKKNNLDIKIKIFSPELDGKLISSLESFLYPKEFEPFIHIVKTLIKNKYYEDNSFCITLYIGDAREYIKNLDTKIDIVYQDAFSSDVNKELWTLEYFKLIRDILSDSAIITTYSIATPVRLSMYENNLHIYEYKTKFNRKTTIASTFDISEYLDLKYIDMELKKINNPQARALIDNIT